MKTTEDDLHSHSMEEILKSIADEQERTQNSVLSLLTGMAAMSTEQNKHNATEIIKAVAAEQERSQNTIISLLSGMISPSLLSGIFFRGEQT